MSTENKVELARVVDSKVIGSTQPYNTAIAATPADVATNNTEGTTPKRDEPVAPLVSGAGSEILPDIKSVDQVSGDHFLQDHSRPFPTHALPPKMRNVVGAVSELYRVPESLAACGALGVISAAIGKGLKVASIPGKTTPANLYILVGVPSGTGKSLVFDAIVKPIIEHQRQLTATWASTEMSEQPGGEEADDAQHTPPVLVCENITSEALAILLSQNDECLASMSADARDVIDIVSGRYGGKGDALYLNTTSTL